MVYNPNAELQDRLQWFPELPPFPNLVTSWRDVVWVISPWGYAAIAALALLALHENGRGHEGFAGFLAIGAVVISVSAVQRAVSDIRSATRGCEAFCERLHHEHAAYSRQFAPQYILRLLRAAEGGLEPPINRPDDFRSSLDTHYARDGALPDGHRSMIDWGQQKWPRHVYPRFARHRADYAFEMACWLWQVRQLVVIHRWVQETARYGDSYAPRAQAWMKKNAICHCPIANIVYAFYQTADTAQSAAKSRLERERAESRAKREAGERARLEAAEKERQLAAAERIAALQELHTVRRRVEQERDIVIRTLASLERLPSHATNAATSAMRGRLEQLNVLLQESSVPDSRV